MQEIMQFVGRHPILSITLDCVTGGGFIYHVQGLTSKVKGDYARRSHAYQQRGRRCCGFTST